MANEHKRIIKLANYLHTNGYKGWSISLCNYEIQFTGINWNLYLKPSKNLTV